MRVVAGIEAVAVAISSHDSEVRSWSFAAGDVYSEPIATPPDREMVTAMEMPWP
jgi:hypothetical protein